MGDGNGRLLRRRTISESKPLEEGDEREHSNKVVSFIKVLGSDFSQKLQMPEEFTVNFSGQIPHRFIIESTTTNKCWRVKVEKDEDGRIYFGDGWCDFVEAHLLEVGNFLVFDYEEQSIFQVKIYGRNGCLKTTLKETNDDHALGKSTEFEEEGEIDAFKYEQEVSKKHSQQMTKNLPSSNNDRGIYKKQNAADKTYTKAAKVSITENSVCFSVTLRKKYQFVQMTLPKAISIKKKLRNKEKLVLEDPKGKHWPVKLVHKRSGHDVFAIGWKDFLKDNEVAAGDTLHFEFISNDLIRVDVARASQVGNHFEEAKCQNKASGSPSLNGALYEPVILTPNNNKQIGASIAETNIWSGFRNSFSIIWRNTTTGTYLHIPKSVAESQNLKDKDSVMLRGPEGKCWPLEVKTWCDGRMALTKGWPEFWKEHDITAGDSLSFEFLSECLLQVTINRGEPVNHVIERAATNSGAVVDSMTIDQEGGAMPQDPEGGATPQEAVNNDRSDMQL